MTWYLVPAGTKGDKTAKVNLVNTIENAFPIGQYLDQIDKEVRRELVEVGCSETVHMWGAKKGQGKKNPSTWGGMNRGDRVILYSWGKYMYLGTVLTKLHDAELGVKIWPPHKDSDPIFEYIYFLVDVQKIDIEGDHFNKLFDYTKGPQAFSTIGSERLQSVIAKYGSVEEALETLMGRPVTTREMDRLDKKDDDDFQSSIESQQTPSPPMKDEPMPVPDLSPVSGQKNSRKRNAAIALRAITDANYKCEIDSEHKTFLSKATGKPFVEAHHLIPISVQGKFNHSLDVPANIIALCPNCHRAFHHALPRERNEILKGTYQQRKGRLEHCGITLDFEELIHYYV